MKYVLLIYSHPEPWGHPTIAYTPEGRALPTARREAIDRDFDDLLAELNASGEFVTAEALADPGTASTYRWGSQGAFVTDGPFAETKEVLVGFFLIDCASRQRAQEIAARFAAPGDTVELRPAMSSGG